MIRPVQADRDIGLALRQVHGAGFWHELELDRGMLRVEQMHARGDERGAECLGGREPHHARNLLVLPLDTSARGQHLFLDGGLVWTHFFKNVGVEDYLSPSVGIGWQINDASRIRVGARGDLANGYTSVGGEISLTVSY